MHTRKRFVFIKSVTFILKLISAHFQKHLELLLIMCALVRDGEDLDSQGEGSSQPDTISLASRTSQNTLDSDKVSQHTYTDGQK